MKGSDFEVLSHTDAIDQCVELRRERDESEAALEKLANEYVFDCSLHGKCKAGTRTECLKVECDDHEKDCRDRLIKWARGE